MSTKFSNCKVKGKFKYISLGDVHLGHRLTPTEDIILNLDRYITDTILDEVDMVIITGDLFDRQLNNGDDCVNAINRWITHLMYRCSRFKTMIRIVEGTPSHDRGQPIFFVEQKVNANIDVDLLYVDKLDIEYNEKLNAHFLYVPDKWRPSTEVTLMEVRQLLEKHKIEQVDFAIMHGAFSYQLPAIVKEPTHDETAYLELVKYHILIGHVHIMTIKDRIFAAGSFDRICHNDEIPKGFFFNTVKADGTYTSTFIENKHAKIFMTLDVHGMGTKELFNFVNDKVKGLPRYSYIRLRCNPNDVASGDIKTFVLNYPKLHWDITFEKQKVKKSSVSDIVEDFNLDSLIPINKESILGLVEELMKETVSDFDTIKKSIDRLATLIN